MTSRPGFAPLADPYVQTLLGRLADACHDLARKAGLEPAQLVVAYAGLQGTSIDADTAIIGHDNPEITAALCDCLAETAESEPDSVGFLPGLN